MKKVVIQFRGRGRRGPPPWAGRGRGCWSWHSIIQQSYTSTIQPQVEKPTPNVLRVITTTIDDRGVDSQISPRFTRAPFIMVIDIVDGRIYRVTPIPNTFMNLPHGAGVALAQWIISSGAKAVIAVNMGPNAAMILQQAGVKVYTVTPGIRVIDALKSLGLVRF